jgi:hypothetical protein
MKNLEWKMENPVSSCSIKLRIAAHGILHISFSIFHLSFEQLRSTGLNRADPEAVSHPHQIRD